MSTTRIWYHKPEWIAAALAAMALAVSAVAGGVNGLAQVSQNTQDIKDLRAETTDIPAKLARIEQKVDDIKEEVRRRPD